MKCDKCSLIDNDKILLNDERKALLDLFQGICMLTGHSGLQVVWNDPKL